MKHQLSQAELQALAREQIASAIEKVNAEYPGAVPDHAMQVVDATLTVTPLSAPRTSRQKPDRH